jgi:hypothetical protein
VFGVNGKKTKLMVRISFLYDFFEATEVLGLKTLRALRALRI